MIIRKLAEVATEDVDMEGVRGAAKQLVLGDADGVPAYSVRVFTLEPGGFTPRHAHASEHLNYVIAGRGELVDPDGAPRELATGDFAFVPPGELHQFRNSGAEPFVFICTVPKEYE
ncbi:cupin domain-containing protein [bacterium]|nr:cupin domain-containing protein [bacterium]MBU1072018.1 cupin domain-containing protein [bacterium]MBU1676251.1 cupin domain-containing protein [bacterium]